LCKKHGIPANKTNEFMAEALSVLLNVPILNLAFAFSRRTQNNNLASTIIIEQSTIEQFTASDLLLGRYIIPYEIWFGASLIDMDRQQARRWLITRVFVS
jgi:hypothetical protein